MLGSIGRVLVFGALIFLPRGVFGQNSWPDHRWDHWYFGTNNGWKFENNNCLPLPGSSAPSSTGPMVSVSDPYSGELLFYGNASGLFDHNGDPMPTCVCPEFGVSGEVMVCAVPGLPDLHYLFYVIYDDSLAPSAYTLRYAVIDMSLNNGLGDVSSVDHIVAEDVRHYGLVPAVTNDTLWLLIQSCTPAEGNWYRFPITANGVGSGQWIAAGYLCNGAGSPIIADRTGTLLLGRSNGQFQLFHFLPASGTVADLVEFNVPPPSAPYQLSADGTKLYVYRGASAMRRLEQYDLTYWNADSILGSVETVFVIDSTLVPIGFDLKLGPDDRIYVATGHPDSTALGVINEPDLPWPSCDYQPYWVPLSPGATCSQATRFPNIYWPHPLTNVSVEEQVDLAGIIAYPNPASGEVTFRISDIDPGSNNLDVRWLDASGRLIRRTTAALAKEITLSIDGLEAGIYEMVLSAAGSRTRTVRVAIQ